MLSQETEKSIRMYVIKMKKKKQRKRKKKIREMMWGKNIDCCNKFRNYFVKNKKLNAFKCYFNSF